MASTSRTYRALATLIALAPATAFAQVITTTPATTTPVSPANIPVSSPWLLTLMVLTLACAGLWMLRRGHSAGRVLPVVLAGLVLGVLWQSPSLRAQLLATFTQPGGETLAIPVQPIPASGDIQGFQIADFSNASGAALRIDAITLPTSGQCFPAGATIDLQPPAPPSGSPPPACAEGMELADGGACRVDVDTMCRDHFGALPSPVLTVSPASLSFAAEASGVLTATNTSTAVAAINVQASIAPGSSLSVVSSSCGPALAPGASCSITLGANTAEGPTPVTVAGDNTVAQTAAVTVTVPPPTLAAISPNSGSASGGGGVTLTGTRLSGATAVTFDGIPAISVNVISSTTVTAVTPAHSSGVIDVAIATPDGGATLGDGYTYLATAVGQPSGGGVIASLDGGLMNLVAANADNSTAVEWGGASTVTNAISSTDGAANTSAIVSILENNGGTPYAAQICRDYEVDSQGNTPCQDGNVCYNDWFLPAQSQLNALFMNQASIGGFASAMYHSSTEDTDPLNAIVLSFLDGTQMSSNKALSLRARCVRQFTP